MLLGDLLNIINNDARINISDANGNQLPYGHREKACNIKGYYDNREIIKINLFADVLYIRIK